MTLQVEQTQTGAQGAPEGHDEKMATKFDEQGKERPDPAKVETETKPEGEAKDKPEDGQSEGEGKPEGEADKKPEGEADDADAFGKFSKEFTDKGELSDESYTELAEKHGIPRETVDSYIQAQRTAVEAVQEAGYAIAGGSEEFGRMSAWAKANLSAEEITEFNTQVSTSKVSEAVKAVSGLRQKYLDAVGTEPSLIEGEGNSNTGAGYKSRAEMTNDMRDPRYKKDPAFRAQVQQKIRNSNSL